MLAPQHQAESQLRVARIDSRYVGLERLRQFSTSEQRQLHPVVSTLTFDRVWGCQHAPIVAKIGARLIAEGAARSVPGDARPRLRLLPLRRAGLAPSLMDFWGRASLPSLSHIRPGQQPIAPPPVGRVGGQGRVYLSIETPVRLPRVRP